MACDLVCRYPPRKNMCTRACVPTCVRVHRGRFRGGHCNKRDGSKNGEGQWKAAQRGRDRAAQLSAAKGASLQLLHAAPVSILASQSNWRVVSGALLLCACVFLSIASFRCCRFLSHPPAKLPLSLTLRAGAPVGVKFAGAAHDVGAHARGGKDSWPPNG